jgi:hypothetical protein
VTWTTAILSFDPRQTGLLMLLMTVPVLLASMGVARLLHRTSVTPMGVVIGSLFFC